MKGERRTHERCGCTLELPGMPPAPPSTGQPEGVGARRPPASPRRGGGGYLTGRTTSEFRKDPRLAELAEIGLPATWLGVAELVGYDTFVAIWRHLSANPSLRDDSNQIALTLRPFRTYERYQRNRYIETLVAVGLDKREIHERIVHELGESIGYRQLKRLVAAAKVRR